MHQERAAMHERGDADHELIEEHEREHFAGTSADRDPADDRRFERTEGTVRDGTVREEESPRR
jgi:hypothetical protein